MRNVPDKFEDAIRSLQEALAALPSRSEHDVIVSCARHFVRWVNENDPTNNLATEAEWHRAYNNYEKGVGGSRRRAVRIFGKHVGGVELGVRRSGPKRGGKDPGIARIELSNHLAAMQIEGSSQSSLSTYSYQLRHFLAWIAASPHAQSFMSEEGWPLAVAEYMKSIVDYNMQRQHDIRNCIRRFGIFLEYEPAE